MQIGAEKFPQAEKGRPTLITFLMVCLLVTVLKEIPNAATCWWSATILVTRVPHCNDFDSRIPFLRHFGFVTLEEGEKGIIVEMISVDVGYCEGRLWTWCSFCMFRYIVSSFPHSNTSSRFNSSFRKFVSSTNKTKIAQVEEFSSRVILSVRWFVGWLLRPFTSSTCHWPHWFAVVCHFDVSSFRYGIWSFRLFH